MAEHPRIMIADDDPAIIGLLRDSLGARGYSVIAIGRGQHAYEALRADPPDLALLDARLGEERATFELIQLLTLDPVTRPIPCIVATSASEMLNQHQGQFASQGIFALLKPYAVEDLLLLIEEKLRLAPDLDGQPRRQGGRRAAH